jgi:error-prone DNA polymerase
MEYVELRCRSNFSFLRGASHPDELIERAAELEHPAIAITDVGTLAGAVRMHVGAKALGMKLLVGSEIPPADGPALGLYAMNRRGYGKLARLITVGRRRAPKGAFEFGVADVFEHSTDLVGVVFGCEADDENAKAPLSAYREVFGDRLYLAAQVHGGPDDRKVVEERAAQARRHRLPLVAVNDVHYHVPARRYLQDVLVCIREGCTLAEAGTRVFPNGERYLKSATEMAGLFGGHPAALAHTLEIADRCSFNLDELRYEYPPELCPPGKTPMEYLAELTWAGAVRRYPAGVPEKVRGQVAHELELIGQLGYEHYFLTVWDTVTFARGRGILCQGRGSAANSAVCYCLGVTSVDPDSIDLLFERFISAERNEPPDIDVDFEHERREEVLQYIYGKYGRDRAGIAAEVITYRPKSAVRDVGKALGFSLDRVDAIAKKVEWWSPSEQLEGHLRAVGLDPEDRTVRALMGLVREIMGFPRHLSQHVGGFVMTAGPLCELVPIENAAMPERTFIEWDKDDIDALGILKVDCLGLGMLTAIRKCFDLIAAEPAGLVGQGAGEVDDVARRAGDGCQGFQSLECEIPHHSHRPVGGRASRPPSGRLGDKGQSCPGTEVPGNHRAPYRADLRQGMGEADGGSGMAELGESSVAGPRIGMRGSDDALLVGDCADPSVGEVGDSSELGELGESLVAGPRIGMRGSDDALSVGDSANPSVGEVRDRSALAELGESAACRPRIGMRGSDGASVPCDAFAASLIGRDANERLAMVPAEDPAVYDMICRADTVGVFQIESRAQMSMLPRLRPRCFYDLVIEVAIVRPGPIQGGMVHPYLRRRNGEEKVTYPSPDIADVLKKTLGVPLFQEQAMKLAIVGAGFSPGEADQLRRSMAAWRRSTALDRFESRLIDGMLANGYERKFAEQLFAQIRGFGEYGFPESHAASFALLVYVSCWMKWYHPAAFAAAVINSQPMGFYAPAQLVRDAREHGVTIRGIDVNHSAYDCTLEPDEHGPALRLGLRLVKGLSESVADAIVAGRRDGVYRNVTDVMRRSEVSPAALARLAAADAFGSLGLNRRDALWSVLGLEEELPLFAGQPVKDMAVALPELTLSEHVVEDYAHIGLSLKAHPMGLIRETLAHAKTLTAAAIRDMPQGRRVNVAGLVLVRQRPSTALGIVFMTIEDETGTANLVIRPKIYERFRVAARSAIAVVATGRIERQGEVVHVQIERLSTVQDWVAALQVRSRDFH